MPFADEHIDAASEVMGLMLVLFLGGVESTAGLVSTLFKLLAENPDQRAILRENPALIPDAVEEAIRYATPLQLVGRTTSREVTLHGVTIPAGGRVVLVYGAANRDERQFPDPDRFDVTRGAAAPPRLRRGPARLPRRAAGPAGGHGRAARRRCRCSATTRSPAPPERYRRTPNMYVWEHLHLAFPVTDSPVHHEPLAHLETVHHRTDTTVVTRELETRVRVAAKQQVADGVVALTLRPLDGRPLPAWTPGAHVDLLLGGGVPNRQYSLCGDPADRTAYRLGVLRDPNGGGGSRHVHDRLAEGDVVRVRGPRNNFALAPAPRYQFVAGGIGITPILPMIAAAEAAGAEWNLVYGGRHRASMAFLDELAAHGDRVSVAPAGRDRTARPGDPARHSATGRPGVLLRPRTVARRRRAALLDLARGSAARRAVRRPAAERAGPRRGVRHRAGAQRAHADRPAAALHPRRRRGRGGGRAVLLRRRHLRHVRDRCARRAARSPRLGAHPRGAGRRTTAC